MNTDQKLDMILNKIQDIDLRLKKIESQTTDIHHYVPFVGWLDEKAKTISLHLDWITTSLVNNVKMIVNKD